MSQVDKKLSGEYLEKVSGAAVGDLGKCLGAPQ